MSFISPNICPKYIYSMLLLSSFSCVATCPVDCSLLCTCVLSLCLCSSSLFMFVCPVPFCFFPFLLSIFFPFLLFAFFVLTSFTISLLCACFMNFWFVLHLLFFIFGYVLIVSLAFLVSFAENMRELCLILIYIATVYALLFVLMPTTVSILFFLNRFACMCSFWPLCLFACMC